ncbi:WecB/TagA/CpsF family glycosyltransferase [Flavobacterium sp. KACC 22763]|uniref:WecB/TagA/CpsF family glycosyltransferase n=1 Tax=Flavobacterium sp. KACC 22763 TaxID=3025668 RepID=UPI00236537BC|nr:WecB/TagA/CpsF family glycosyltransferase [Flavobacterium sp. KACC 22763]WDF62500.1 WecB/TagA/CpsF family glycosyltransferase [Flavobacterium sp. KACC 22763]
MLTGDKRIYFIMTKPASVVPLMDYSIYSGDLSDCFTGSKVLINTINQYSYCIAEKDLDFKKALLDSDILLPDGVGIISAVRLLTHKTIKKIAGADIHQFLLANLNKKGGTCFYLGSSQNTLNRIASRVSDEFPNIKLSTFSPPYKDEFSPCDIKKMLDEVNGFKPDVLFVGMTAPKQEKWSNMYKNELDVKLICSIGAVFDFYADTIARPSNFWINIGLEWFVRLVKEPKRMWKRYLYYGPVFIKLILEKKIKSIFK